MEAHNPDKNKNMDDECTILLHGLRFYGNHGLLPGEQENGQRFELDLEIRLAPRKPNTADEINTTVDYTRLYQTVEPHFTRQRYKLIETCAERIAGDILRDFPTVNQVTVTLKKPSVPVPCICDYFGVRIRRQR